MALLGKRSALRWIAGVVLLGAVATTSAPADARPAQDDPAVGEVRSSAYSLRLAPAIGGTALTMTFGGAGSLLQNAAGTGIAAAADLGLIATIFQSGVCGFAFPFDVFPPSVLLTNAEGDGSRRADIVPTGEVAGIGAQSVSVTTDPSVVSDIRMASLALEQTVALDGLHATARAENPDGATPSGHAVVTTDLVVPGLVELRGLRWEAEQTGGDDPGTASFTFTGGTVLGVPLPPTDLVAAAEVANTVLAPLGLRMILPKLERVEGTTPIVRMTPLVLGFVGSPVLNTVLEPLLSFTRTLKEQLVEAVSSSCFSSYGGLLADLALGLVIGTGRLDLLVGGVEITTNDDAFEDPFGSDGGPAPVASNVLPPSGALPGAPFVPSAPGAPLAPVVEAGAVETVCESTNPNGADSCSDGSAVVAGALAVAAVLAAAAADLALRRRRAGRAAS